MKRTPILLSAPPMHVTTDGQGWQNLMQIFDNNIVEVTFRRRDLTKVLGAGHNKKSSRGGKNWHINKRPTGHKNFYRRMLLTRNFRYISSPLTRKLYDWKKPKKRRGKAWYRTRKLIIVWDIIQNDWRMIDIKKLVITGVTPIAEMSDRDEFSEFYRTHLKFLAESRRDSFSDTAM